MQTVVGKYGIDERERNRLLIFLAESVDGDLDRVSSAARAPKPISTSSAARAASVAQRQPVAGRVAIQRRNGKIQEVHMSKMGYTEPSKLGTSLTNWLAGASVAASMAARG